MAPQLEIYKYGPSSDQDFSPLSRGFRSDATDLTPAFTAVGLVATCVLFAMLVLEAGRYTLAYLSGTRASYSPLTTSALDAASDAWLNRHSNFIGDALEPFDSGRGMQETTYILDSLSTAWRKWGEESSNQIAY